jgi:hypothetical protein
MTKPVHPWTPEKLVARSKKEVEVIRENALKKGVSDLVGMCDLDLKARKPAQKSHTASTGSLHSSNEFVEGYHFVCQRDRGVMDHSHGRFWTGSWVVAEANVQKSLKYNSYVALHESKSDLSYRQGRILDYRRSPRDMLADKNEGDTKTDEGIEFLVQEEATPYPWHGGGSGEKGYKWSQTSSAKTGVLEEGNGS